MQTDNQADDVVPALTAIADFYMQRQEELLQLLREALPYIKGGHWPPQNRRAPELAARMEKALGR